MKSRHVTVAFILLASTLLSGCGKTSLTNQMAEHAIQQWPNQTNISVKVLGIQEVPQQNIAIATVTLSHFVYNNHSGSLGSLQAFDYSGPAKAIFTHYNDGRYVLTHVEVPDETLFSGTAGFDMNVEAR